MKRSMALRLAACTTIGVAAAVSWHKAMADYGVGALRVACSDSSDSVEIEPFIAWGDGNSPYPQFGAEQATDPGILHDKGNWFYAVDLDNPEDLHTLCQSKTRLLRVFITNQHEITVTEGGRAVIDAVAVGDPWRTWAAIYLWRSTKAGEWEECYGPRTEGYKGLRCEPFDPAHPKTRFLSEPADCDEFRLHLAQPARLSAYALEGQETADENAWHIDLDRDGTKDTLSRYCPGAGSVIPADPCSFEFTVSATGKSFSIEEDRLYLIEYARRVYVVGGRAQSETGPFHTDIYLLKGDGPQKVCTYELKR